MKKIAIFLFLLIFALAAYFYFNSQSLSNLASKVESSKSEKKNVFSRFVTKEEGKLNQDIKEVSDDFDRVEKQWNREVEELFFNKLGLNESDLKAYLKMRESFETSMDDAIEIFHARMKKEKGENYSYNPSEMAEFEKDKLIKSYEKKLLDQIGEEAFKKYLEVKDSFNELQRSKASEHLSPILVEF